MIQKNRKLVCVVPEDIFVKLQRRNLLKNIDNIVAQLLDEYLSE